MNSKYSTDRNPIVENMGYRVQDYHRMANVQIGTGNANGEIVVVQPHATMPDRDAITGALKNFGMLNDSYRATSLIVDHDNTGEKPIKKWQDEINRYYLRELIQVIRPSVVIACGPEALAILRGRKARSFGNYVGKTFDATDISNCVFFSVTNPADYGFNRAPQALKEQGKREWTEVAAIYRKCKEKLAKERWAC